MPRTILTGLLIAIFSIHGISQHRIEGTLAGLDGEKVLLLEYFGDKHRILDSARTDNNGWFSFSLPRGALTGLYSLALEQRPLFNFIYNKEDIILKFDPGKNKSPEFIFSIENLIYYDYLMQAGNFREKTAYMTEILQYYPERDSFYTLTKDYFSGLQDEFERYTNRIIDEYPHTFVARIIASDRPFLVPDNLNWQEFSGYSRAHYLDRVDFSDTLLINTDVITGKAIEYLGLYSGNQSSKEAQERYFIQAVDTLLHKAMESDQVFDFLMQYLIEGFERYGFDRVISHIAENYEPAGTCIDESRKSELQSRIENLRRLAIGKAAPDIEIPQKGGSSFRIGNIKSDLVVVVFWASWCPHCETMMPQIKSIYDDPSMPDFEVMAISIDTSAQDYAASLATLGADWISYCDFEGWDTGAAVDYSIYATPTMFLLDRERTILARPASARELRMEIMKNGRN